MLLYHSFLACIFAFVCLSSLHIVTLVEKWDGNSSCPLETRHMASRVENRITLCLVVLTNQWQPGHGGGGGGRRGGGINLLVALQCRLDNGFIFVHIMSLPKNDPVQTNCTACCFEPCYANELAHAMYTPVNVYATCYPK